MIDVDVIQSFLTDPDLSPEGIEQLQGLLGELNSEASLGIPAVSDAVYDRLKSLLEQHAPDSKVLHTLWDEVGTPAPYSRDNTDMHLSVHPMQSIRTIKSYDDNAFMAFASSCSALIESTGEVNLHFSHKIDGHGVRAVYVDGVFHHATSRARNTRGRDLTAHFKQILPPTIPLQGIVEVRGELCLTTSNLEQARAFTPTLKTPFSAVSSLIKPSATYDEVALLDFLAYRVFTDPAQDDSPIISSRTEEYELLESLGFTTPGYESVNWSDEDFTSQDIIDAFDSFVEDNETDYFCDGVVVEIDYFTDQDALPSVTPSNDMYRSTALALKTGDYAQGIYTGIVDHIEWTPGRVKLSPVAVLADGGVITEHGNTVQNVPLYEPININNLQAWSGNPLSFYYGGEAGVVPCYPDGTLLTDGAVNNALSA